MNYRTLSADDYARLAGETRELRQWEAPCGGAAILTGSHALFGSIALALDGERYTLALTAPPALGIDPPGRPECPMGQGDAFWAHTAAVAGILAAWPL